MDPDDLLRLADLNLAESYREMARWHARTEIVERDSMLLTCGPDSFAGLSFAMRAAEDTRPSAADFLKIAKAFFAERKRGFSIRVRSHADADLAEACGALGLPCIFDSPGMVLDGPLAPAAAPEGVELLMVRHPRDAADFGRVVAESYENTGLRKESAALQFALPDRLIAPHLLVVVASVDGAVSSCAMGLLSHGIAGIYWVGTVPSARRRGLAELCTRAVGNHAFAQGARKVVLQASAQGEPVYRAMGYREFTRYPWFLCPTR
jgi:ribosomal protein S18 acetylase RimI-like enzyme